MGTGDRAIKLYVRALDLSGVFLAARDGQAAAVHVGCAADPPARVRRLGENARLVNVLWCVSAGQAELVAEHVRTDLASIARPERGSWFGVDVTTAGESVTRAVRDLGVCAEGSETVEARAAQAVAQIEQEIAALQKSGGMKTFNKSYREYRLKAQATGETFMLYAGWLQNYKLRLIRTVAEAARTLDRGAFGNLERTERTI